MRLPLILFKLAWACAQNDGAALHRRLIYEMKCLKIKRSMEAWRLGAAGLPTLYDIDLTTSMALDVDREGSGSEIPRTTSG